MTRDDRVSNLKFGGISCHCPTAIMKLSVVLFVAASCLLAGTQVQATYKDGKGTTHWEQHELDTAISPDERERLVETMVKAHQIVDKERSKQRRYSPKDTYAPVNVPCPPMPEGDNYVGFVRNATNQSLNPNEAAYVKRHRQNNKRRWADWLKRAGMDDNGVPGGVDSFLSDERNQPRVGFAASGGGYRAMLVALGVAQGFDERNKTAMDRGVGGLLQLADYFAGLSGGSWATGSMAINDWPTMQSLVDDIMDLSSNLVKPSHDKLSFYKDLFNDVSDKKDAGYPVSISDYWSRALSYQLLNKTDHSPMFVHHGQRTTYSDIVNTTSFKDASYPLPIVLSIGRPPNEIMINPNATYFEFTPFEFGTWQPYLQAFFPVGYLGSDMRNGKQNAKDKSCVANYDNFGYVVGTSSTLFNGAYTAFLEGNKTGVLNDILKKILEDTDKGYNDVAPVPNPFKGYRTDSNVFWQEKYIDLVDGGEANQNIPFEPLLQPARELDMIIGIDVGSDHAGWPNGTDLWETQRRMQLDEFSYMAFPKVPEMKTFVNRGYNTRPTFFGCNPKNATNADKASRPAPLVVYLPNYPYTYMTNASTFELAYNVEHQHRMLDNSVDIATMGGNMSNWHECLACASVLRSLQRSNTKVPSKCQKCLDMYCWDGTEDESEPGMYTPPTGAPAFVASHGKKNVKPPVTGSNDTSESTIGEIMGSKDDTGNSAPKAAMMPLAMSAAMVCATVLTMLM